MFDPDPRQIKWRKQDKYDIVQTTVADTNTYNVLKTTLEKVQIFITGDLKHYKQRNNGLCFRSYYSMWFLCGLVCSGVSKYTGTCVWTWLPVIGKRINLG